jgi:hypothetical protein
MYRTFNLTSNMLINHFLETIFPTQFVFFFFHKMSKRNVGHLTSCVVVSFDFFFKVILNEKYL